MNLLEYDKIPLLHHDIGLLPTQPETLSFFRSHKLHTIGDIFFMSPEELSRLYIIPLEIYDDIFQVFAWMKREQRTNSIFEFEEEDWDLFQYDHEGMQGTLNTPIILDPKSEMKCFQEPLTIAEIRQIKRSDKIGLNEIANINFLFNYLHRRINASYLEQDSDAEDAILEKTFTPIQDIRAFMQESSESLSEKEIDVLMRRLGVYSKEETLEEIGAVYNVTRERIRQIQGRAERKLNSKISQKNEWLLKRLPKAFRTETPGELIILINSLMEGNSLTPLDQKSEHVFAQSIIASEITGKIAIIEEAISLDGYYAYGDKEIPFSEEDFKSIFAGKYEVDDNSVRGHLNTTAAIRRILKESETPFNMGIKSDVDRLLKLLKDRYDIDILQDEGSTSSRKKLLRNLEAQVDRAGLRWENRTYIHSDNLPLLPDSLTKEIIDELKKSKITTAAKLYDMFEFKLRPYGYKKAFSLYAYLRFFFKDEYSFGGVSEVISLKDQNDSWSQIVIDEILHKKSPLSFESISAQYPAITPTIWTNLSLNNEDIISYGTKRYYLKQLLSIYPEEQENIYRYINGRFRVTRKELFIHLLQTDPKFLERNRIVDEGILMIFIKHFFKGIIRYERERDKLSIEE